jgi:spoIIIJ-associated protein
MTNSIEIKAKTVLDAIDMAAEQLGVPQDELEIEILEQGGMFKKAAIKATRKEAAPAASASIVTKKKAEAAPAGEKPKAAAPATETPKGKKFEKTTEFVTKLLELLGNDSQISTELVDTTFNININGENIGILIGKSGMVLTAIQTLTSSIARNYDAPADDQSAPRIRVIVNIGDYRDRRVDTVHALDLKKAEFVKKTGKQVELEPMNPRDRAIIHTTLQNIPGIKTFSTGKEPHRRLCISPDDTPKS